jgi:hypothetical protein
MITISMVIYQLDLKSRTLAWPMRPLHMGTQLNLSQTFITDINQQMACNNTGTWFAFWTDMLSNIAICTCILLAMQEQSTILCSDLIPIWYYAKEPICMGRSWRAGQASIALSMLNGVLCLAGQKLCVCSTVVCHNLVSKTRSRLWSPLQHLWLSRDHSKCLKLLSQCSWWRCSDNILQCGETAVEEDT